jgi:hypothetical protein
MAIKFLKSKSFTVVDKTLAEISDEISKLNDTDIAGFYSVLKEFGVDYIETNTKELATLERLPLGMNYLFKIEKPEDIGLCIEKSIKYCLIDEALSMDLDTVLKLYDNGIDIMVEMKLESIKNKRKLISLESKSFFIKSIRVVGINFMEDVEWMTGFINDGAGGLSIPLDICRDIELSVHV